MKDILLKEFKELTEEAEAKINADQNYIASPEFITLRKRLITIMRQVEGCGCGGRGQQINAMAKALMQGKTGVAKAFGPLIFKSFKEDFLKILRK